MSQSVVIRILVICVLGFIFPVTNAHAATNEVLQVSSLNSNTIYSNTILEVGKLYKIEASSTYTFAPGGRLADAEFAYDPDTNSWHEDFGNIYEQYVLDLLVNGTPQDWLGSSNGVDYLPHTFSPNHIYRLYILGQGLPVTFYIHDASYDWNEGNLSISISKVLPADKVDCKNQAWKQFSETFKNQGMCLKSLKY